MKKGEWFQTYSGRSFYPFDCTPDDIDIDDIAHALSLACRFGGHCRQFYSVAQHSILVSENCEKESQLIGLLHDATEAYIGDMVKPLKVMMPEFQALEKRIWRVIAEKFYLPIAENLDVKLADQILLITEARDLLPQTENPWWKKYKLNPLSETIRPMASFQAEACFRLRFEYLHNSR